MTDFNKILEKAKELESKVKESQEKIKNIKAEGSSGAGAVKIVQKLISNLKPQMNSLR